MRQLSANVYAEMYVWGCNPGFLVTSVGVLLIATPQQPIAAVRWREAIQSHGKRLLCLVNTEPHQDHIRGNMFFPGVEVIGQTGLQARYDALAPSFLSEEAIEAAKRDDPDSVFLIG